MKKPKIVVVDDCLLFTTQPTAFQKALRALCQKYALGDYGYKLDCHAEEV